MLIGDDPRDEVFLRHREQDRTTGAQVGKHLGGDAENAGVGLENGDEDVGTAEYVGEGFEGLEAKALEGCDIFAWPLPGPAIQRRDLRRRRPTRREISCCSVRASSRSSAGLCFIANVPV